MTWASLGLVVLLGTATLLTNDPRFVLAKPSIAHFAIGAVMLKRGWMLRYMPPIVAETIPEYVTIAGFGWAVLMFALGLGTIAVAATGDMKLWAIYVSVVAVGAKVMAFAIQYVTFRLLLTSRLRVRAAAFLARFGRDHGRAGDLDQHVVRTEHRIWDLVQLKDLGRSEPREHYRLHALVSDSNTPRIVLPRGAMRNPSIVLRPQLRASQRPTR